MKEQTLELATQYLGTTEGSPQHQEILNIYNSIQPLPRGYTAKLTDDWCAIFISALAWTIRIPEFPHECSVYYMEQAMKTQNWNNYPTPGDIITFTYNNAPNHVGIVLNTTNTTVTTIEGNSSNKVSKNTYSLNNTKIRGYYTPKYEEINEKINENKKEDKMFLFIQPENENGVYFWNTGGVGYTYFENYTEYEQLLNFCTTNEIPHKTITNQHQGQWNHIKDILDRAKRSY